MDDLRYKYIINEIPMDKKIYIWGAISYGMYIQSKMVDDKYYVLGYIDSFKTGTFNGLPIFLPDELINKENIYVIVVADFYNDIWDFLCKHRIPFSYLGGKRKQLISLGIYKDNKGNEIKSESREVDVIYGLFSRLV